MMAVGVWQRRRTAGWRVYRRGGWPADGWLLEAAAGNGWSGEKVYVGTGKAESMGKVKVVAGGGWIGRASVILEG
nr:unnamed protein product [Digitaria exilis]